jgi:hypothetical protein
MRTIAASSFVGAPTWELPLATAPTWAPAIAIGLGSAER